MISMSKEKMIQYLNDYANLQYLLIHNQNESIGYLFSSYMIKEKRFEDNTIEYYDIMRRVYHSYIAFKKFSMIEDFLLNRDDYLNNNDLAGIETDLQIESAPTNLSNKKIIQYIRNAFNHNASDDHERFKISPNGKFFEIDLNDLRTSEEKAQGLPIQPFKIKFNQSYLDKVNQIINSKSQNIAIISFNLPEKFNFYTNDLNKELDKIKLIHYNFAHKMSQETIARFKEIANTRGLSTVELAERSKQLHELAKTLSEPDQIALDSYQKTKVIEFITRYKKFYPELLTNNINGIMYYFLSKVIPSPSFKNNMLMNQINICDYYLCDINLSLQEIINRVNRVVYNQDITSKYDEIDKKIHESMLRTSKTYQYSFYEDLLDGEVIAGIPIIMFIDAVISHYCEEEYIRIDHHSYVSEKLRNSFVHGRWYLKTNQEIVLYDSDPRNVNMYNYEYIGTIKLESLYKWSQEYLTKKGKVSAVKR